MSVGSGRRWIGSSNQTMHYLTSAYNDRDLNAHVMDGLELAGHIFGHLRVDPIILGAHKRLAGEFEQDAFVDWSHKVAKFR